MESLVLAGKQVGNDIHLPWNVDPLQGYPQIDDQLEWEVGFFPEGQGACSQFPIYVGDYLELSEDTRTVAPRGRENPRKALAHALIVPVAPISLEA